jgi:hypothetical protein
MPTRRTAEEIQKLLEGYRQRGGTRAEYCRQQGITESTLDYFLRRYSANGRPRLARVKIVAQAPAAEGTFALLLGNGRRIESAWNFRDADLARLIRIAEGE